MLLQATDIFKSFAGVQALKGICFDLLPGEVHGLVGENGAGKSTLIKILAGALEPDAGSLAVGGKVVDSYDPVTAHALGIAAIYQQPALFPDLTVAENIAFGTERGSAWRRIRWRQRRERARLLLERVGASIAPDDVVRNLSMPEQQLVEIARSLGSDANVLIMDEPTASLSEREVERLFRVIRQLRAQGVGIIYISHRLEELFEIGDRVTVFRDGCHVHTCPLKEVTRTELIRLMVGRELDAAYSKSTTLPGNYVLELLDLSRDDSGVKNVCLAVRAGEILGLAGLVGAGRTELARILFGITPADRGTIRLNGKPVTVDAPVRAVQLGIGYVPEDRRRHGVILEMPIVENISMAVLPRISRFGMLDRSRERGLAADFVRLLDIKTASIDAPVATLSGGNQQKAAVARWLATEPRVLILDEPTQGIDVGAKGEIHRLIRDLAKRGLAIILISSELPEILGMSDRIAVMRTGAIEGILERGEATQEKVLALAFGHGPTSFEPEKRISEPEACTSEPETRTSEPEA